MINTATRGPVTIVSECLVPLLGAGVARLFDPIISVAQVIEDGESLVPILPHCSDKEKKIQRRTRVSLRLNQLVSGRPRARTSYSFLSFAPFFCTDLGGRVQEHRKGNLFLHIRRM